MILTVEELRTFITTDATDEALEALLQGLESAIRAHTNNNFQKRAFRLSCPIVNGNLFFSTNYLHVGDTIEISDSALNDDVYTITEISSDTITLNKPLIDEDYALVTKIVYPADIKMGVVNLVKWELSNRDKVGVSSESLSRHSISYFNLDGDNSEIGYPRALISFLNPYMKARF